MVGGVAAGRRGDERAYRGHPDAEAELLADEADQSGHEHRLASEHIGLAAQTPYVLPMAST